MATPILNVCIESLEAGYDSLPEENWHALAQATLSMIIDRLAEETDKPAIWVLLEHHRALVEVMAGREARTP